MEWGPGRSPGPSVARGPFIENSGWNEDTRTRGEPCRRTGRRSQWQIFPGDLATTLSWEPETDLHLERSGERVSSHELVNDADQSRVRVIAAGETWPDGEVKKVLKGGRARLQQVGYPQF